MYISFRDFFVYFLSIFLYTFLFKFSEASLTMDVVTLVFGLIHSTFLLPGKERWFDIELDVVLLFTCSLSCFFLKSR